MSSIFISHSGRDNVHAAEFERWLKARGHDDVFLDFHKDDGISVGVNWKGALAAAMQRCHVVLALISDEWFASAWCQAEQAAATMLGKQVIPVIVGVANAERRSALFQALQQRFGDIQFADLTGDREAGLARVASALGGSTVTPMAFPVPDGTAPYRGLSAFGVAERGLYFGREGEVQTCLELLRQLADADAGSRMLAILGASGAGKSSLLRAGLVPQLRLRPKEFISLEPVTLARDPFGQQSIATAIEQALTNAFLAADVRFDRSALDEALRSPVRATGADTAAYAGVLDDLRRTRGSAGARVVLSLDQAETLLQVGDGECATLLRRLEAFVQAPGAVAMMVMRSDSFGTVLERRLFERFDLSLFALPPVPLSRLGEVIRGPARRVGLRVDEALIDTAIADAGGGDALPLLSVTFEGLWRHHGASGHLTLAQYEQRSGLHEGRRVSPIDNSVRLAADEAVGSLNRSGAQALVDAFIPGLVNLSDGGEFVRRRGSWNGIPADAAQTMRRLEQARLLTSGEGGSLEVTHEALLRRWPMLAEQLERARPDLRRLKDVERCTADWSQGGRDAGELRHSGERLKHAQALARRPAWARRLGGDGRAYLEACAGSASTSRRRVAVAAAALLLAAGSVWLYTRSDDFAWRRMIADAPDAAQEWNWPRGRFALLARAGLDGQLATEWKASAAAARSSRQGEMCEAAIAALEAGRAPSARAALRLLFDDERTAAELADKDRRWLNDLVGLGAHCVDLGFPLGLGDTAMKLVRKAVAVERPDGFYAQGEALLMTLRAGFVIDATELQFDEVLKLAVDHAHPRWGLDALSLWLPLSSDARGAKVAAALQDWAGRHPEMMCGRGRVERRVDSGDVDDFSVIDAIGALRQRGFESHAAALTPFVCSHEVAAGPPPTAGAWPADRANWLRWAAFDRDPATRPKQPQGQCEALWALLRRERGAAPSGMEGIAAVTAHMSKSACDLQIGQWLGSRADALRSASDWRPPYELVERIHAVLRAGIVGPQTADALYWAFIRTLMGAGDEYLPLVESELTDAARHGKPVRGGASAAEQGLYELWSRQGAVPEASAKAVAPACQAGATATVRWLSGAHDEARQLVEEALAAWKAQQRPGATLLGNPRACLAMAVSAVHDFDGAAAMALGELEVRSRDGNLARIAVARALAGDLRGARETTLLQSSPRARADVQSLLLGAWQHQ